MGIALEVTIRGGTWNSPEQSMTGTVQYRVTKNHFLCARSSIGTAFSFGPIKTCHISSRSIVFWSPGIQKFITLSHRVRHVARIRPRGGGGDLRGHQCNPPPNQKLFGFGPLFWERPILRTKKNENFSKKSLT